MPFRSTYPRDRSEAMLGKSLKALSHPQRRTMFLWILQQAGAVEYRDLRNRYVLPMGTLSRHLVILRNAGLIETQRRSCTIITISRLGVIELAGHFAWWARMARSKPKTTAGSSRRSSRTSGSSGAVQ